MPEYRIAPDQGVCPEGHPCHLTPELPAFRQCDEPHDWSHAPRAHTPYTGAALLDVYTGPVGVEAFHEAAAALRALMSNHEAQEHPDHPRQECPGVEVCSSVGALALRAIQDVLDPLPSYGRAMDAVYAAAESEAEARRSGRSVAP